MLRKLYELLGAETTFYAVCFAGLIVVALDLFFWRP